jgi:hypothetical protein
MDTLGPIAFGASLTTLFFLALLLKTAVSLRKIIDQKIVENTRALTQAHHLNSTLAQKIEILEDMQQVIEFYKTKSK